MQMRYQRLSEIPARHQKLLDLIRAGQYSTPALADKLDVCDQTVYRDISYLKQQGHKVRSIKQSHTWAYVLAPE